MIKNNIMIITKIHDPINNLVAMSSHFNERGH